MPHPLQPVRSENCFRRRKIDGVLELHEDFAFNVRCGRVRSIGPDGKPDQCQRENRANDKSQRAPSIHKPMARVIVASLLLIVIP